jgi:NAD(P)H-hydrate repair Nnr-like enzyme with NAD(P)H-hydrate dehydratase domain
MATAGCGDVLAGMIGANIAKINKYNPFKKTILDMVAYSSLIHSLAADYYVNQSENTNMSMETLTASDIINNIGNV